MRDYWDDADAEHDRQRNSPPTNPKPCGLAVLVALVGIGAVYFTVRALAWVVIG